MPYPMGTNDYSIGQEKIPDDLPRGWGGLSGLSCLNDDVDNSPSTPVVVVPAPAPEPAWTSSRCLIMALLGAGVCFLGLKYFGGEQIEE